MPRLVGAKSAGHVSATICQGRRERVPADHCQRRYATNFETNAAWRPTAAAAQGALRAEQSIQERVAEQPVRIALATIRVECGEPVGASLRESFEKLRIERRRIRARRGTRIVEAIHL